MSSVVDTGQNFRKLISLKKTNRQEMGLDSS